MPKLNITHKLERLQMRLKQLESGEEIASKDIKALLEPHHITQLEQAHLKQDELRKTHKRPKTEEEKQAIGWKTKLQLRIEVYKQAIVDAKDGMTDGVRKLQQDRETKAARIYLDAYFKAEQGVDKESAGNIALTRAGFNKFGADIKKRDEEKLVMEDALRQQFESEMTEEEKEQLEIVREHEQSLKKNK
jgi:hypothetical protein